MVRSLSRRKRALCVSAVCLLVLLGAFVYYLYTQKSIIIMNDGDTDELIKAADLLIENDIDAKLYKGGTVLAVPKQSLDDARLLLAANCVFTPDYTSGLTLAADLDEKSREYMQVRAKADAIKKSIKAVEGVDDANVLLSIPSENALISAQDALTTASVVLDAPNGLSDEQINGIAEYITKCIADLKLENISILEPNGNSIFENGKVVRNGSD